MLFYIILCYYYIGWTDPEHQRASGNLKYFEFQLEKQRKAAEEESQKEKVQKKRETTEKKSKPKKPAFSLIPERKKYEMLCRGEGIRMVRKPNTTKRHFTKNEALFGWHFISRCIFPPIRRLEGRVDFSAATMTATATPTICFRLQNNKTSGIGRTLSATLMLFPKKKWRRLRSWPNHE